MQIALSKDTQQIFVTVLCCSAISALAAMDFGLLWFFWVGFFLFVWTLVRLIQCIAGKVTWRYILVTLLIWGIGFTITYGIHHLRSKERQGQAHIVVSKILQFHQSNVSVPRSHLF